MNYCVHCGSQLRKYTVPLGRGLVNALVKFRKAVVERDENKIHLQNDLDLTKNEYNNFQKLRYHALVAKYKKEGEHVPGYWLITHRGAQFLNGLVDIPRKVQVYNNKIVGRSSERVKVGQIIKGGLEYETIKDIHYEDATPDDVKVSIKARRKRRKNPCPECDGVLKIKIEDTRLPSGEFKIKKSKVCIECNFEAKMGVDISRNSK